MESFQVEASALLYTRKTLRRGSWCCRRREKWGGLGQVVSLRIPHHELQSLQHLTILAQSEKEETSLIFTLTPSLLPAKSAQVL